MSTSSRRARPPSRGRRPASRTSRGRDVGRRGVRRSPRPRYLTRCPRRSVLIAGSPIEDASIVTSTRSSCTSEPVLAPSSYSLIVPCATSARSLSGPGRDPRSELQLPADRERASGSPGLQHGEDIAREVEVEGQLEPVHDRGRQARLGGGLEVAPVGVGAEPRPDRGGGRRISRLVPPSSDDGARTTGPRVCSARVSASTVTSGVSGSSTASVSTWRAAASSSTCRIALPSGGLSSAIACAPRSITSSRTPSSGEITQVSHPGSAWVASMHVLEHRQGERGALERLEHGAEPGLCVAERLHGKGDDTHGPQG